MTKFTKRDKYLDLIAILNGDEAKIDRDELVAFCEKEIASIDNRAVKAKERAAKKKADGDELSDRIFETLTHDFQTIDDIVMLLDDEEVTKPKVSYRIGKFVKNGTVEKAELTVDKARRIAYKLVD